MAWKLPQECVVQIPLLGRSEPVRCTGTLSLDENARPVLDASWAEPRGSARDATLRLSEARVVAGSTLLVGAYPTRWTASDGGLRRATFGCNRLVALDQISIEASETLVSDFWSFEFSGLRTWAELDIGPALEFRTTAPGPAQAFIGPTGKVQVAAASVMVGNKAAVLRASEFAMRHSSRLDDRRTSDLVFDVTPSRPITFEEFANEWLAPVASFVAFGTGASLPVAEIRCVLRADGSVPIPGSLDDGHGVIRMLAQSHEAPVQANLRPQHTPIAFGSFGSTPGFLAAWINLHAALGARLEVFCSGLGAPLAGLGARNAFVERLGFVTSVGEHLHERGGGAKEVLRAALTEAAGHLGSAAAVDELAQDMVDARHYLMHMSRGDPRVATRYRELLSSRMGIFAETLKLVGYSELLRALGFRRCRDTAEVLRRVSPLGASTLEIDA